jgi:hypothetical protein
MRPPTLGQAAIVGALACVALYLDRKLRKTPPRAPRADARRWSSLQTWTERGGPAPFLTTNVVSEDD